MGPLEVKQRRNLLRRYCCMFTCLASRSTHLEMAYDLTTGSFPHDYAAVPGSLRSWY